MLNQIKTIIMIPASIVDNYPINRGGATIQLNFTATNSSANTTIRLGGTDIYNGPATVINILVGIDNVIAGQTLDVISDLDLVTPGGTISAALTLTNGVNPKTWVGNSNNSSDHFIAHIYLI